MKTILKSFQFIGVVLLLALATGCATTKNTEQALLEAGLKPVAATTEKQTLHLKSLQADKLSVVNVKGKMFFVFPDPAHNQIYLGNAQAYQDYQQILMYSKMAGNNRVMAALGEDSGGGGGSDKWVEWNENTGWTSGTY